jgi:hypothetical protein
MTARLGHPHPEALASFMHGQGGFIPDRPEPTILQGSPPPRRRRSVPAAVHMPHAPHAQEFEDTRVDPMSSPRISPRRALSDALLSRAFGASPLLFQHADTTPVHPDDETSEESEASEIESLKKLSMDELLDVFRGKDPAPPHPSPNVSYDPSPWSGPVWPPLPSGPPPPTAMPSPPREPSAWSPAASAALAAAHRRPGGWSQC